MLEPIRTRHGFWVFDDITRGLIGEPFVGDTNILIDLMSRDAGWNLTDDILQIPLLFSLNPFPGFRTTLELLETSPMGSTYHSPEYKLMLGCVQRFLNIFQLLQKHFMVEYQNNNI
jgi:hypothetical protein